MAAVGTLVRLADLPEVTSNAGKIPGPFVNASWISLRYDLGIPSDATIVGAGSPSATDAGYGTRDLDAFGSYPAQTVTQRIQAALDRAASGPVGLNWDVACAVGTPAVPGLGGDEMLAALWLRRPGNLHIVGRPGCGAILRAQCNSSIFSNELPTFGTPVSGAGTDQQINSVGDIHFGDVTFENLYLNVNSGLATSTTGGPNQLNATFGQNFYLNGIRLFGVRDITFLRCTIVGACGFHLYFGNWQDLAFHGCTIDSQGAGENVGGNDGIHLNGPGTRAVGRDNYIATNDDGIALNTADGNNHSGRNHGPSAPAWGSITGTRWYNTEAGVHWNQNFTRVMAAAGCANGDHEFHGVTGTSRGLALLVNSGGAGPGWIGPVEFHDLAVDLTVAGIQTDGTTISGLRRVVVNKARRSANLGVPLLHLNQPVRSLALRDIYTLDDGSSGTGSRPVVLVDGSTVTDFAADGIVYDAAAGGQDAPLLKVSGATVGSARISNASAPGSAGLVANGGTIGGLVVSNTGPATVAFTGTAPAATSGDYFVAATSYTLTGPSSGTAGVPSSAFAITPNGSYAGTVTITPSGGGLSTPIVRTFSGSSAPQAFAITPTAAGTVTLTPTNSGSLADPSALSYAAGAAPTAYLDETFTGTSGASITGHAATPTNNGSDAWTDFTGSGFGAFGYAAGGGATALSVAGPGAYAGYALTGVPQDQAVSWTFTNSSSLAFPQFQMHRTADGADSLGFSADYGNQKVTAGKSVAGSSSVIGAGDYAYPLATGVTYTLTATTSGGTLTLSVSDGTTTTTLASGVTIPTGTGTVVLIGQTLGSAGDVKFVEVRVTS